MRSISGPEMRFWYFVTIPGEQVQALTGSLVYRHGQACSAIQRRSLCIGALGYVAGVIFNQDV